MATTRIMPLHIGKGRTVSSAISDIIDYVQNPDKTDGGRLITGYACDSRTVDAEFMLAKREYISLTGRVRGADDVIAYHLHRELLRVAIDNALTQKPESLEALFLLLQQAGIQLKRRGKSISLQAPGQSRFARTDTLGDGYSEAALAAVLAGEKAHTPRKKKQLQPEKKTVNLLVDIQAKLQAGKSAGYARWANDRQGIYSP